MSDVVLPGRFIFIIADSNLTNKRSAAFNCFTTGESRPSVTEAGYDFTRSPLDFSTSEPNFL